MNGILKVAIVQTSLHWEAPKENMQSFSKKIDKISEDVHLILLPEMFTTGFTMNPDHIDTDFGNKTVDWMKEMATKKNATVMGSIVFFEKGNYFNRLFAVDPQGSFATYDKRHTFTLAGEDKKYKKGDDRISIFVNGFKVCPLICYDLRFPVWSRNVDDYDVLVYLANWPTPRIAAWDVLLRARAIENMSYCVGVNRTGKDELGMLYPGHSAAYDYLGRRLAYSDIDEILEVSLELKPLQKTREKLGFLKDMDHFLLQ